MSDQPQFAVQLKLLDGYRFEIDFAEMGTLFSDEPAPLGDAAGPNPSRLLAASVANCLAASLLFAIRKFKEDPGQVSAVVRGELERQDGRWRIGQLDVELQLGVASTSIEHLDRALAQFENFCVVTQSVRQGIVVNVAVKDAGGALLHTSD